MILPIYDELLLLGISFRASYTKKKCLADFLVDFGSIFTLCCCFCASWDHYYANRSEVIYYESEEPTSKCGEARPMFWRPIIHDVLFDSCAI